MEAAVPWIGDLICIIVYGFVGLKLWNLSKQTSEPAEQILGIAILLWAASYLVYDIPFLLTGGDERIIPALSMSSFVIADLGNFAFAIFTWVVFRRRESWALGLLALIAGALVLGWVGSAWMGDWEFLGVNGSAFHWCERIGASLTSVWMGVEAFRQYAGARRRQRLGLCKPLACNRYLLLGCAAGFWIAMDAASMTLSLVEGEGILMNALSTLLQLEAILSTLGAVLIGLAFFPPASYRHWIQGSPALETA